MRKRLSTDAVIVLSIVIFVAFMGITKFRRSVFTEESIGQQIRYDKDNGGLAYLIAMADGQLTFAVLVTAENYHLTDFFEKWGQDENGKPTFSGYVRFQDMDTLQKHYVPIKRRGEIILVEPGGVLTSAPGAFLPPAEATDLHHGKFDLARYPQLAEIDGYYKASASAETVNKK